MKFRTDLQIKKAAFSLEAGDGILLLGSCFSDEVGRKLQDSRFNCICNPFGVLYNPLSILNNLQIITGAIENGGYPNKEIIISRLFKSNGVWYSWLHSTNFFAFEKKELEESIAETIKQSAETLKSAKALIITFGTNRVYFRNTADEKFAVANCHKQPAADFKTQDLGVEEIISAYCHALEKLFTLNPGLNVVFTISPYRYIKYGLHGSNLGKAALMLAVDGIVNRIPGKFRYFPTFEIQNDELRDYRFYAEDMVHPSKQAVDYIYERFAEYTFSAKAMEFAKQWNAVAKLLLHKPQFPQSSQYMALMASAKEKIAQLGKKHPQVRFDKDLEKINEILTQTQ